MAKRPDDDLFKESTMTFGEHLEELRVCLFKGLIGFAIGVCVGLYVAEQVMNWMQRPLKSALEQYYVDLAVERLITSYPELSEDSEVIKFIRKNRVVFEVAYVERQVLDRMEQVRQEITPKADSAPTPTTGPAEAVGPVQPSDSSPPPAADATPTPRNTTPPSPEATPDDADEEPTNTTGAADKPQAEKPQPDKPQSEKPQADKQPNKNPTASTDPDDLPDGARIAAVEQVLPTPSADMIKGRFWKAINTEVKSLNAQEAFMIWLKAAFVSGVIFASPWIFYQIWLFVAAGLYPHEKNYVYIYLPISLALFLAGAALAFFMVFGPVLSFLFSFNKSMHIDPDPRISEWLGFVLLLPLGFGISFQLPLVMLFIHRIGIISLEAYLEKWRVAILSIFVISMVLTPADPVSMMLMAGPLTLLYFVGIGMCKWMPKSKNPYAEAYEP